MAFKVLLADDERIIVEGISNIIDWKELDTELVATARNGIEAYEKIELHQPDIVISDIRMPGMDGLNLVKKVYDKFPSIKFILLSGFGEFEYARTAMQFGVKQYLLKPCNEEKITEALQDIVEELKASQTQEAFIHKLKEHYEKAQPFIKAQMLTEFLSSKSYSNKDLFSFQQIFDREMENKWIKLILFRLEGEFSYERLYALKKIGEEILDSPFLSTSIGEHVVFLINDQIDDEKLHQQIDKLRAQVQQYFNWEVTVAISGGDTIQNARRLYHEALECLEHRFYLGIGCIITRKDLLPATNNRPNEFVMDEQQLCLKIKSGHIQDVCEEISELFEKMSSLRLGIHTTKSYCIQLYLAIVQAGDMERMQDYLSGTSELLRMETVHQMFDYIKEIAEEITIEYFNRYKSKQSNVIHKVIDIVEKNLSNPDLSLKMVANEMLYMNPDYLGKLFKQETGQRFSAYLTKLRIEKAVEHILEMDDVKVVTLAEMIGFGENPQYFSQVFKKHTGYTPSEYRKVT
jgi:two-component system, response regulator YesN